MGGFGAYLVLAAAPEGMFQCGVIQMGYGMGTQDPYQISISHQPEGPGKQVRIYNRWLDHIASIAGKCAIIMQHSPLDTLCAWSDAVRAKEHLASLGGDAQLVEIPRRCFKKSRGPCNYHSAFESTTVGPRVKRSSGGWFEFALLFCTIVKLETH